MILVVSHYTKNKGTAHFFLEYLRSKKIPYIFLKHPFYSENIRFSDLTYWDGIKEKNILKVWKINNPILVLIEDFFISIFISIRFGKKINKVIAFGGFNFFPFIIFNNLFKRELFFWGCDYATKRFNNFILNKLYLFFETISCKYAILILQPTIRQQKVRLKKHKLDIRKSIIIPNGISSIMDMKKNVFSNEIALIYTGSITRQHGIVDFVNFFYLNNRIKFKLYIFGGGDIEKELENLINQNFLSDRVFYFGVKNQDDIMLFVKNFEGKLFGLAPYISQNNDHVYYGDSIKIKEYINYGIPFITSNTTYLESDIKSFGFVYNNFEELNYFFDNYITKFKFDEKNRSVVLRKYLWNNIFLKIVEFIKI